MFEPSLEQARRFFVDTWSKHLSGSPLTPLEAMTRDWLLQHPEYHALLGSHDAVQADFSVEHGDTNPFLHLGLHLSIAEQLSIDQPPGIRAAYRTLSLRLGSEHDAAHRLMDALAETIWQSQRDRTPLDAEAYLERINRAADRGQAV